MAKLQPALPRGVRKNRGLFPLLPPFAAGEEVIRRSRQPSIAVSPLICIFSFWLTIYASLPPSVPFVAVRDAKNTLVFSPAFLFCWILPDPGLMLTSLVSLV